MHRTSNSEVITKFLMGQPARNHSGSITSTGETLVICQQNASQPQLLAFRVSSRLYVITKRWRPSATARWYAFHSHEYKIRKCLEHAIRKANATIFYLDLDIAKNPFHTLESVTEAVITLMHEYANVILDSPAWMDRIVLNSYLATIRKGMQIVEIAKSRGINQDVPSEVIAALLMN